MNALTIVGSAKRSWRRRLLQLLRLEKRRSEAAVSTVRERLFQVIERDRKEGGGR
ncbi:MAG: hypothetical protein LBO82_06555 [Synergistaceae bacterium]|jgi:hypothetical protein|nr:hypothetical protein [Synergistaceae bacterium]